VAIQPERLSQPHKDVLQSPRRAGSARPATRLSRTPGWEPARYPAADMTGSLMGSEPVRRHSHHHDWSASPCGVSCGPRACGSGSPMVAARRWASGMSQAGWTSALCRRCT